MAASDDFLTEARRAGLYDPERDGSTGRAELLQWLRDEHGVTLDEMVEAAERLGLEAIAGDRRIAPGPWLSLEEASARSGMSAERLEDLTIAFGLEPVHDAPDGGVGFRQSEIDAFVLFDGLSDMFSLEEAFALVRVMGSSLSRIAEAAVSLFLLDVEEPHIAAGRREDELSRKSHEAVGLLDEFPAILDAFLRRHVLQTVYRTRATMTDPNQRHQHRYAVAFVDLVGFTARSADMAPQELSRFLRDFEERSYRVAANNGARVVKLIGDEVMIVAVDPSSLCRAASGLVESFRTDGVIPRAGAAFGDVLLRGGDYFGSVVNLASRLVDEAVPGELLVSMELGSAATDCAFDPAGRRMVKGFADPVEVRSFVAS